MVDGPERAAGRRPGQARAGARHNRRPGATTAPLYRRSRRHRDGRTGDRRSPGADRRLPRPVDVADRPYPVVTEPTDAVVRVVLGCVCGSDLWYYRGESPHALGPIGHEFIGVVEQVGAEVRSIASGDLVIAPFTYCDGTCPH